MGLAILCPGQGAQHPAMFELIAAHPAAREVLREANEATQRDLVAIARSHADIFRNAIAQPLICSAELATWTALAPLLPPPALFAGYSVGELAAYGCAGALSPAALARLAVERAALMDGACDTPTSLVALRGMREKESTTLCKTRGLGMAIVNSEEHFILGGPTEAIRALETDAAIRNAQFVKLPVTLAAHTPWLARAADGFREVLHASSLVAPAIPVLAGIDARAITRREDAVDTLARQVCTTIRWSACMHEAVARGCRVFLELGPGCALARMIRERFPDLAARSVAEFRSVEGAADWVTRNL